MFKHVQIASWAAVGVTASGSTVAAIDDAMIPWSDAESIWAVDQVYKFFMIFNVYVYGCIRSIHKWSSKVHVCKDVPLAWMCREILWRFECSKVLKFPLLNCSWVSWRYTAQSYSTQSSSKRQSLRPFESTKLAWSKSGISRAQNARGAKLNWQLLFFLFLVVQAPFLGFCS